MIIRFFKCIAMLAYGIVWIPLVFLLIILTPIIYILFDKGLFDIATMMPFPDELFNSIT